MFVYDKTFDPKVVLGHCDLVSWFSDFALYLDTVGIFFILFLIMNEYDQTALIIYSMCGNLRHNDKK